MRSKINSLFAAFLWFSLALPLMAAPSTDQVWQHHIEAWSNRDLNGIVADYNDDSVLVLNGKTFKGPTEIRSVFTQLFEIFDHGQNKIDPAFLQDRFVYITWHFTPNHNQEFFGSDTFVIEKGKIVLQTIASELYEQFPVK